MKFYLHHIQSPILSPHVKYILFNFCDEKDALHQVTSFANNNVCLGIIKEKKLIEDQSKNHKITKYDSQVSSYLSGMYLCPHHFINQGALDEICIDFTPTGFYHFFKIPQKKYILNENVLLENFEIDTIFFFEKVFEEKDFQKRGQMIESFLVNKLKTFENNFLKEAIQLMENNPRQTIQSLLLELQCSEKKLYRNFKQYFDISPKDYLKVLRFRKALNAVHHFPNKALTTIAYETGYFDQSHFIKDFTFFTDNSPKAIRNSIQSIGTQVLVNHSTSNRG